MNLLASLADRVVGRTPVLQRRQPTLFEPANEIQPAVMHDETGASLRESEMHRESEINASSKATTKVHAPTKSRPRSRTEHQDPPTMLTPQAIDLTIVEPAPQVRPIDTGPNGFVAQQEELTTRASGLRDMTDPNRPDRVTTDDTASIATIVETKLQREVILQKSVEKSPIEEADLLTAVRGNPSPATADNAVGRRPQAGTKPLQKQVEPRLIKPAEQRRTIREEAQRAPGSRLQSTPAQLVGPTAPTINVTIGRVEVKASAPSKRAESARPANPKLSLEDYLRGRSKGTL
jgi:hypothetical protein